jgi:hypothetical protein
MDIDDYLLNLEQAKSFLVQAKDDTTGYSLQQGIEYFQGALISIQTVFSLSNNYRELFSKYLLKIIEAIDPEEQ